MPRILISYRRLESAAYAGRLYDRLVLRFPRNDIFMDIEALTPGDDFARVIRDTIQSCDIVLVLIGPNWATVTASSGKRRLEDPQDLVHLEVAEALQRDVRVIPVLTPGAQMPAVDELPGDLSPLLNRQAVSLSDEHFHRDVSKLVESLKAKPKQRKSWPPRKRVLALSFAGLCVLILFGTLSYSWFHTIELRNTNERPPQQGMQPRPKAPISGGNNAATKPQTKVNPKDGLEYVLVLRGEFQMGCVPGNVGCTSDEKPRHRVVISKDFWLGRTEVTQLAYGKVMRTKPVCRFRGANRPMESVSWAIASRYCATVGGRLPTEAEWEYAARGGMEGLRYPWGDEISKQEANYAASREEGTVSVGSYPPNPVGLSDMAGNVWEWVADWYGKGYYAISPILDPNGPSTGRYRIARGGAWINGPDQLRASHRLPIPAEKRAPDLGFRCAIEQGAL